MTAVPLTSLSHGAGCGCKLSAADLRASVKFNPDGQTVSLHVNPVFSTTGRDVALPRVPLIPGGEGR